MPQSSQLKQGFGFSQLSDKARTAGGRKISRSKCSTELSLALVLGWFALDASNVGRNLDTRAGRDHLLDTMSYLYILGHEISCVVLLTMRK